MDIDIAELNLTSFSVIAQVEIQKFTDILTFVQYLANVVHLFVNGYFAYGIYATSLMHPNLKILVITIATQYSFIAIGRIGETLNSTVFYDKPIVITNVVCILCKMINDTALIISCTSILLIGIERLLATKLKSRYAQSGSRIGSLMLGSMITVGIFFSGSTLLYDSIAAGTFDLFETRTSCQNLFTHPLILPLCWCFALITFLIGTTMLVLLFRYNKFMMQKYRNDPLPVRYQYSENIMTLKVLVPAVAGYGVMIFLGMTISIYAFYALLTTNQNSFDVQMAFQFLYMIADFYGIYFVMYVFVKYRPMNQRLKKHWRWLFSLKQSVVNRINPIDRAEAHLKTDAYFQQLQDVWTLPLNAAADKQQVKMTKKKEKTLKK